MYFTGIDLHKKTSYLTTIDKKGGVVARAELCNLEGEILEYFFALQDETRIVIESSSNWYWLYDLLDGYGYDVIVSNPAKTKAIASAKIKNDKIDSHMLAQLLRANLISTVYVSSLETRQLKELLRHRTRLVRDVTRIKNRIHTILAKNNVHVPFSDLFGVGGLEYLRDVDLPEYHREHLETYLRIYAALREQIEPLTERIHGLAKANPSAKRLMTIPGIGPIVAMYVLAEIEDISRFPSYRNLSSYAGLVPSLDASGGKERKGRITKQGSPHLRTAMIEAAQVIPRMKRSRLNLYFRKRIVRGGYQKAIVATAHKLLQIVYFVLKNDVSYQEEYPASA